MLNKHDQYDQIAKSLPILARRRAGTWASGFDVLRLLRARVVMHPAISAVDPWGSSLGQLVLGHQDGNLTFACAARDWGLNSGRR